MSGGIKQERKHTELTVQNKPATDKNTSSTQCLRPQITKRRRTRSATMSKPGRPTKRNTAALQSTIDKESQENTNTATNTKEKTIQFSFTHADSAPAPRKPQSTFPTRVRSTSKFSVPGGVNLAQTSSYKNMMNLVKQASFEDNDPNTFLKLVDEENKRASLLCQSNEELTDNDKKTLAQVLRIQGVSNPLQKSKEDEFKVKKYTLSKSIEPVSEEQRKIPFVIIELLETERRYLQRIKTVCKLFLNPIRKLGLLNAFETVSLFSNIETIVEVNESFLNDLENALQLPQDNEMIVPMYEQWVSEIFIKHASIFQPVYGVYCTNQPTINATLSQYNENIKFANFIRSACRKAACKKQTLNSLLISPLQRLCKYPLLLREIQKLVSIDSVEYKSITNALNLIRKCVDEVNQKVKRVENVTKLAEIQMELSNGETFRSLIMDPTREFIMKEYLIVNEKIRNVFLFDHMILITKQTPLELKLKPESDKIEHYIVHVLMINFVTLAESSKENSFVLESGTEYLFTFKDDTQKKKWSIQIEQLTKNAPATAPSEIELRSRTIRVMNSPGDTTKRKRKSTSFFSTLSRTSFKGKSSPYPIDSGILDQNTNSIPNSSKRQRPNISISSGDIFRSKEVQSPQLKLEEPQDYKVMYLELQQKYEASLKANEIEIQTLQSTIETLRSDNSKLQTTIQQLKS